jgi:hypothetical protein
VDYDMNIMRKRVNEIQKEISAKKKVGRFSFCGETKRAFHVVQNNIGETTSG